MVKELSAVEFTERLSPIFEHISKEVGIPFAPEHFFPRWRALMEGNVARTWENDGCILGALLVPDMLSCKKRALVYFWFSLPEARGTGRTIELLEAAEQAAADDGCEKLSIASHSLVATDKTARIYQKRGYDVSETVYTKSLCRKFSEP